MSICAFIIGGQKVLRLLLSHFSAITLHFIEIHLWRPEGSSVTSVSFFFIEIPSPWPRVEARDPGVAFKFAFYCVIVQQVALVSAVPSGVALLDGAGITAPRAQPLAWRKYMTADSRWCYIVIVVPEASTEVSSSCFEACWTHQVATSSPRCGRA